MKKFIAIFLFFLLDAIAIYILYTKPWIKVPAILAKPTPTVSASQNASTKTFSNADMHIAFNYPKYLQLTQINPHLISIQNPSNSSSDSSLFIFESTIPHDTNVIDLPFVMKGKKTHEATIPIYGFDAKQLVYGTGKTQTNLISLRTDNYLILVRIPKDSKGVEEAINDFVNTVTPIH